MLCCTSMKDPFNIADLHFCCSLVWTDTHFQLFSTPLPLQIPKNLIHECSKFSEVCFRWFSEAFLIKQNIFFGWISKFSTSSVLCVLTCVTEKDDLQSEVPHLACSVYYSALKDLPAMVRLWWNSQEKRVVSTVDKFTSKYVSSVLSAQEIASVQSSTQTFDSMTVRHSAVNSISGFHMLRQTLWNGLC